MFGNNKQKFLTVAAFIIAMSSYMSANTQNLIAKQRIKPRECDLVVRKAVVAGGTVNLLENAGQSAVRGINDFNGDRLTNGRNFVWDRITVNYGVAVAGTSAASVAYTTALPPALLTANIIIEQNGNSIRKLSVAAIDAAKGSDAYFDEFGSLALLVEETTTAIKIEFGEGTSLGAGAGNDGYVEVILRGFETYVTAA